MTREVAQMVGRFPDTARQQVGYQLYRVQNGLEPSDWKPMRAIGPGVREIRIQAKDQFRIIYVASFGGRGVRPACISKEDS
jgi:phage-related protein